MLCQQQQMSAVKKAKISVGLRSIQSSHKAIEQATYIQFLIPHGAIAVPIDTLPQFSYGVVATAVPVQQVLQLHSGQFWHSTGLLQRLSEQSQCIQLDCLHTIKTWEVPAGCLSMQRAPLVPSKTLKIVLFSVAITRAGTEKRPNIKLPRNHQILQAGY